MTDGHPPSNALSRIAEAAGPRGLPPVHLWNPPNCGTIDIVIRADGTWLHEGAPIRRPELVRLFSTVLRKDADGYCLVTPVEKLSIKVEDLPFRAVAAQLEDGLTFTTDQEDRVTVDGEHPLVVDVDGAGQPAPRVRVRGDLWARVTRAVFYELVEAAEIEGDRLVLRVGDAAHDLGAVEAAP
ncbi:MAG: DUF1285 domain-containing protein [Alphaproteobacteria bacterium]|nr:DUF1285 domain-containing protein [Alphaproteobacteria bacterium]MBU1526162.1 DUF1285 domain-containing protein [Alphaproteobacteria bacterium]MBU2117419.1 DUF1285 domain-containing protein [Alphaproteobacteria bacterium]MBU2350514.1 DUF1285 domain-containing protein [Alphaproteobacteria bacterium]MBU2380979.1 DUF1285 domain-containing protein [Alphaproteobacteria bacterium]